jgi:hypothetical protein
MFKVANSTISYGTLTSNSVKATTVTTEDLRVSTVEEDAPAGITTNTVKLYAPTEWANGATGTVFAFSTVKGQTQTSTDPAGLAPSVFVLPAYATVEKAQFGCKYTTTNPITVLHMGISTSNATLGTQGNPLTYAFLTGANPVNLDTSSGGAGSGLTVINTYSIGGLATAIAPQTFSTYMTVTISSAGAVHSGVAPGETLELYLTYRSRSV